MSARNESTGRSTSTSTSTVAYQYVVIRCVPRPEREEFVNVAVVLYCQARDFLACAWDVDRARLSAVDPTLDLAAVCASLEFVEGVCAGDERAGAAGRTSLGQRFGFLKAPRSTVLQPGPVHGGVTGDPSAELLRLRQRLVDPVAAPAQTGTRSTAPTA